MSDRDLNVFTKSPPEQYSNSKIKIKETGEENRSLTEYKKAVIVFYDILGLSNSRNVEGFFMRGKNKNLDIF